MGGDMDIQIDWQVQILDASKHFRLEGWLEHHNSLFLTITNLQAVYIHANTGFACWKMVTGVYKPDCITAYILITASWHLMFLFPMWPSQKYDMHG